MALGDPLQLPCGLVLPNRIIKAALTEGSADSLSRPTPGLMTLYRRWSHGGAGLLITGNCQVDRRFMERPGNTAIDGPQDEAALDLLKQFAAAAKEGGNRVFMQLSHAGRQSDKRVNKHLVGPSAIPFQDWNLEAPSDSTTRALTVEEVADVIERFAHAAKVCRQCGFDGVEIHSAHGYLLSSFLNPLANQRDDEYGGDLENRARLLLNIVSAIRRETAPDFAIAVKINSADFQKGGFTAEECGKVATWLEEAGIDLLEVSGGNYEKPSMMSQVRESTRRREGFFLEFTSQVRASLQRVPLMVTGGFRSREFMEHCLATRQCEAIGIGRPLCVMPDGPKRLLAGELDAFPDNEHPVPWHLYPLYWTRMASVVETVMHLLWFERCLLDLAEGIEKPGDISPLLDILAVRSHDNAQAAALKGLDCVGSILNSRS